MNKSLQIIDWNISYMGDWEKKMDFLFSKVRLFNLARTPFSSKKHSFIL